MKIKPVLKGSFGGNFNDLLKKIENKSYESPK
jgi:hypothetical protein